MGNKVELKLPCTPTHLRARDMSVGALGRIVGSNSSSWQVGDIVIRSSEHVVNLHHGGACCLALAGFDIMPLPVDSQVTITVS
jgi:hypothetical protein